jgi:hypothetical protein
VKLAKDTNPMNKLALATAALAALVTSSFGAMAQKPECTEVDYKTIKVAESSSGYVAVGVRRPLVESPKGYLSDLPIEVQFTTKIDQIEDRLRVDSEVESKSSVLGAAICSDRVIRYQVRVLPNKKDSAGFNPDYDTAKLMLPTNAGVIKIRSCSNFAQQCYEGEWAGTASEGIILKPVGKKGGKFDMPQMTWK